MLNINNVAAAYAAKKTAQKTQFTILAQDTTGEWVKVQSSKSTEAKWWLTSSIIEREKKGEIEFNKDGTFVIKSVDTSTLVEA